MEGFVVSLFVVFIMVFGYVLGKSQANGSWESDCTKLEKHLSSGAVYECRKVSK